MEAKAINKASGSSSGGGALDRTVLDDLISLCPSPDTVQQLLASKQHSADDKARILSNVVLRCASSGDVHLLAWILEAKSYVTKHPTQAGEALAALRLDELRDRDGESDANSDSDSAPSMGPVCLAASSGHIDVVKLLLDYGLPIDEQDGLGWTPLMWAVNSSNLPLVDYLIRRGANVEARSHKGSSCEDFIISVAPEQPSSTTMYSYATRSAPSPLSPSPTSGPSTPRTRDRQLIADAIYDRLQAVATRDEMTPFAASSSSSSFGTPSRSHSRAFSVDSTPPPGTPPKGQRSHTRTLTHQSSTLFARRLIGKTERREMQEADLKKREAAEGRRRALLEMSVLLDVDFSALVGEPPRDDEDDGGIVAARRRRRRQQQREPRLRTPGGRGTPLAPGCGALEVGADPCSVDFDFTRILPSQMIVFSDEHIPALLDHIVLGANPVRAPWVSRSQPANTIFLCLRYAASLEDEDLLLGMLYDSLDAVEKVARAREGDIVSLAFWLFNMTLLLYYTCRDATLSSLPKMREEAQLFIHDLINEIVVAIIRDIERRISKVLEVAMLEHDAIPGFEDVRFEGEWNKNIFKTLKGSVRGSGSTGLRHKRSSRMPLGQIFSQFKEGSEDQDVVAPMAGVGGGSSPRGFAGSPDPAAAARAAAPSPAPAVSAAEQLSNPTPRTVTSLLTASLHVLQLYEVSPAIIVQMFSQVFYWLGSELFNRLLTHRKYLCRSKAMQLKLNVSTLEDWARSNALPLGIVTTHLLPVTHLISWLSCHSTLRDFPSLIATLQGLPALTPMQMRRAVRDYRYEVGEPRMSEECRQYLDQLVGDWQRSREQEREAEEEKRARRELDKMRREILRADAEAAGEGGGDGEGDTSIVERHHRSGTTTEHGVNPDSRSPSPSPTRSQALGLDLGNGADASGDGQASPTDSEQAISREAANAQALIDSLFLPGRSIADFVPQGRLDRSSLSSSSQPPQETLQSSAMLPFALPSATEALIVSPGDAFGFGRGHFAGTGTPSLRTVRGDAGTLAGVAMGARGGGGGGGASRDFLQVPGTPVSTDSASRRASLAPVASPTPGAGAVAGAAEDSVDDAHSETSAASSINSSGTTSSSLFAVGRGFAAGGYWQPVPLLRDETLEQLATLMRRETERQWIVLARKRRAALLQAEEVGLPPESGVGVGVSRRGSARSAQLLSSSRRPSAQRRGSATLEGAAVGLDAEVKGGGEDSPGYPQHADSPLLLDVPHYTTRPAGLHPHHHLHKQLHAHRSASGGTSSSLGSDSDDDEDYGQVYGPAPHHHAAVPVPLESTRPRSTSSRKTLVALGSALARKVGAAVDEGDDDDDHQPLDGQQLAAEAGKRLRKAASRLFEPLAQPLAPPEEYYGEQRVGQRQQDAAAAAAAAALARAKRKASGFSSRAGPLELPGKTGQRVVYE